MALNVKVGSINPLSSDIVTTEYPQTGFGFDPKLVIMWGCTAGNGLVDVVTIGQHVRMGIGFATSPSSRYCTAIQAEDNSATTDNDSMVRDDCIYQFLANTGGANGKIDITSMTDGVTFVCDEQFGTSFALHYIAIG